MTLASAACLELRVELLEQEEDNRGAAEGKSESRALEECFEERSHDCNVVLSSDCCKHNCNLRTTADRQVLEG